jgi:hypothetical protein
VLAVLVDGCDDDVGPEAAAVLLVPLPLVLDTALAQADVEFHLGLVDIEVFPPVEDREVLPYDVVVFCIP